MSYTVITGDTMKKSLIDKVFALDELVYGAISPDFVGIKENQLKRFARNRRSFVCLMEGDKLVGYINFFPVVDRLFDQIMGPVTFCKDDPDDDDEDGYYEEVEDPDEILAHYNALSEEPESDIANVIRYYNTCRDDDIMPEEILPEYSRNKGENNLFIISVAINPECRGKGTSKQLTDAFIEYLRKLESEGYPINSLSAVCVSPDGERYLRGLNFYRHRVLPEAETLPYHERVYLCCGHYLRRLLEGTTYHKTHKDDIYLFVPYADNPENDRIGKLLDIREKYHFPSENVSPLTSGDGSIPYKTETLLRNLESCLQYEYEGFITDELQRIYLGRCLFRHTTDRYMGETVGEEYADLLLLAYPGANMYVLVIYIPNCRYSSSMVGDQLSQMELDVRFGDPDDIDDCGFVRYVNINDYLEEQYGLVRCGRGKAFYCMSNLPATEQELRNILAGETYFSVHQDFFIRDCEELKQQCTTDLAIYDYYQAYMSDVSLAIVLNSYEDDGEDRMTDSADRYRNTGDNNVRNGIRKLEEVATYVFIVELVLLQNTALTKLSKKVGIALEHEGDVSYDYINQIYKDYGRTLKLFDSKNFKYHGTGLEAEQIRKAFGNEELRQNYQNEQEFLERIVDVNSANDERRNGWILGIIGMLLALVQLKDYIVSIIALFYTGIGNLTRHPESIIASEGTFDNVFNVLVWGGILLFILVGICNRNRRRYERRRNLRAKERRDDE